MLLNHIGYQVCNVSVQRSLTQLFYLYVLFHFLPGNRCGLNFENGKKILLAYVTPASQMFSVIIFIIIPPVIIIISYGWYDINQNVGIDAHMSICHLAIQVCDKLTLIK